MTWRRPEITHLGGGHVTVTGDQGIPAGILQYYGELGLRLRYYVVLGNIRWSRKSLRRYLAQYGASPEYDPVTQMEISGPEWSKVNVWMIRRVLQDMRLGEISGRDPSVPFPIESRILKGIWKQICQESSDE